MTLKNHHTPLSALPGLTNEQILSFHARWIWTVEDLFGYARALPEDSLDGSGSCESVLAPDVCASLSSLRVPVRQMGLSISDSERQATLAACRNRLQVKAEALSDKDLSLRGGGNCPSSVRLMDRMLPIRNQAERGTCSAFASVALCEFAHGGKVSLSPQFLYWACKERDGNPHSEGTTLATVLESIDEAGVCEDRLWEYRSTLRYGDDGLLDAGQGPAPMEAVDNARGYRGRCQALSPNAAAKYRRVLASGRPVVVGLMTFSSWTRNPVTEVTGRVFMPHMEETENGLELLEEDGGGHAMCLVGYVDEETAPGGGYFIARNSWGAGWASECAEGAGHALIPYRYVEWFTLSAFTISESNEGACRADADHTVVSAQNSVPGQVPAKFAPYTRVLTRDERDFKGTLLPQGTVVRSLGIGADIYGPSHWNLKARGYGDILSAATYPLLEKDEAGILLSRKKDFCDRIDANFSSSNLLRRAFPYTHTSWHVLPENVGPGIRKVEVFADFSGDLLEAMVTDLVGSNNDLVRPPQAWIDQMKALTVGKILRVTSASLVPRHVYVVEAFAVPFALDAKSECVGPADATARLLEAVRTCARRLLAKVAGDVFYSVGTGCPAGVGFVAPKEGPCYITLSSPDMNGGWAVSRSVCLKMRPSYRDFSDRLMPLTESELLSKVRYIVDPLVLNPGTFQSGVVFVRRDIIPELKKRFPGFPEIRETAVIGALRQMRGEDPRAYAIMQNAKREVFVASPPGRILPGDRPYRKLSWFARFMLYYFFHLVCWVAGIWCTYHYKFCVKDSGWAGVLSFLVVPAVLSFAIRWAVRRIAVVERS